MKTAVLGGAGFIGGRFLMKYRAGHPDTIGTSSRPSSSLAFFDLGNPDIASLRLGAQGYGWALIACGVTGIARCEQEQVLARRINVEGTLAAAAGLIDEGVTPIFLSSDYVFDGRAGGYAEDGPRKPLNAYGRFKAQVEERMLEEFDGRCLIVRLSKVYGLTPGDGTLIDEMARTLLRGDRLRAATNQIFCPTSIDDIVEGVLAAQEARVSGLVNLCAPEAWSRYDIGRAVAAALGTAAEKVTPITLDDLREPFERPKNTSMRSTRPPLVKRFMPVREAIREYALRGPGR
jgi:dTDP-4-dehydrorhamnose reductase